MSKQQEVAVDHDVTAIGDESGPVTAQRTFDRREDGLVIEYAIDSTADIPLVVEIADDVPSSGRQELGFHPDHTPTSWETEGDAISIEHALDPHEECRLMLGIVLEDPDGYEFDLPESLEVTSVNPLATDAEKPTIDKQADDSGLLRRAKKTLFRDDDEKAPREQNRSDGTLDLDDPNSEAESSSGSDGTGSGFNPLDSGSDSSTNGRTQPANEGSTTDRDADAIDTSIELELGEPDTQRDVSDREPTAATAAERRDGADRTEATGEGSTVERTSGDPSTGESTEDVSDLYSGADGPLVSLLVSELRDGIAPDEFEALRDELEVDRPRSDRVRLRHVQARVDDLAAYTELLDEFTDEYGTLSEYADETGTEIESLRDGLEDVDESVTAMCSQLDDLEARIEEFSTKIEDLDAELRSIRDEHDEKIDELTEQQSAIKSTVRHVEDTAESELEELRSAVEEFESMRGALANALGPTQGGDGT